MSEPTKEEQLDWVGSHVPRRFEGKPNEAREIQREFEIIQSIVTLIDHGPEVGVGFIHVWADQFEYRFPASCPHHDYVVEFLKNMLRELGMTVRKGK